MSIAGSCDMTRVCICLGMVGLVGCRDAGPGGVSPVAAANQSDPVLTKAASFLIRHQSADGAWRSDVYGPFKDGGSLTPLVLQALYATPPSAERDAACRKGSDYLAKMVGPDGKIDPGPQGLSYRLYTAAGAVIVLSHPSNARHLKARDAWLADLRQRQLTEALGWDPADKPYGGWGYCPQLPRKPKPGEAPAPLTESNLSATLFALEALRAAGVPAGDPAFKKALVFVKLCQNFADAPAKREAAYDDGGFFFIYDDPVRNKAGVAGKDATGRERYHSYGSTTADGVRALMLCGLPADDPRVSLATGWLVGNLGRADTHPGTFAENRRHARQSTYFYYCHSVARALRHTAEDKAEWAAALIAELSKRQRPDGSWANTAVDQREDDPLVATSLAVMAISTCRSVVPLP